MSFTTRPELRGTFGMVASTHWLASAAGMAVLEQGGNAFDAAVATGLTLQVVEPHLNGPGGDLPALLWPAGRERAARPLRAGAGAAGGDDRALPRRARADARPRHRAALGGRARRLRRLAGDAARARDAARCATSSASRSATPRTATRCSRRSSPRSATSSSSSATTGRPPPRSTCRSSSPGRCTGTGRSRRRTGGSSRRPRPPPATARPRSRRRTSSGTAASSPRRWSASRSARSSTARASGTPGLLTADDLGDWRPAWERPLAVDYHGHTVYKAGPWSQAPVFLQQLRLLEGFDLAAMGHASAEYVHTVTECAKLAFADREAWYGDPDFVDVPMETLLSRAYADERRALVGETAAAELRPGAPDGREPRLAGPVGDAPLAPGVGEPTRGDTVHLDVVDRWGNMVAATPSGGWLWGAPVIPELGFCLGTRAQMFWLEEGLPNSLEPGKRPRTTLTPSLAARDGQPYLAFGTPGRRPAGPVDAPGLPRPRPLRPGSAGRDRRAVPPHRGVPVELLPARDAPAARRRRGPRRRGDGRGPARPRPRGRGDGPVDARPRQRRRPGARTASSRPARTRAACRATPRGGRRAGTCGSRAGKRNCASGRARSPARSVLICSRCSGRDGCPGAGARGLRPGAPAGSPRPNAPAAALARGLNG